MQPIMSQTDTGLNRFFAKVYGYMGMGLGISALVSGLLLYVFQATMINIMVNHSWVYYAASFIELALVYSVSTTAWKNNPMAMPLFLFYSALNGFTLSFILAAYSQTDVFAAFLTATLTFFAMAVVGLVSKRDLSGMAHAFRMVLFGVLIASLINIFLRSAGLSYIMSIVMVVIFAGLTAYDNQRIRQAYQQTGGQVSNGWAISMALSLYLNFINLFLSILRIFAANRD